jgi:hypothetical protein
MSPEHLNLTPAPVEMATARFGSQPAHFRTVPASLEMVPASLGKHPARLRLQMEGLFVGYLQLRSPPA